MRVKFRSGMTSYCESGGCCPSLLRKLKLPATDSHWQQLHKYAVMTNERTRSFFLTKRERNVLQRNSGILSVQVLSTMPRFQRLSFINLGCVSLSITRGNTFLSWTFAFRNTITCRMHPIPEGSHFSPLKSCSLQSVYIVTNCYSDFYMWSFPG